ncbi:hypothetical protein SAMN05660649_04619 [Desulfotomaculum arcticum]|uniref:Uncharacterized protein n=1 Tax=Desulfotruncus arcticus DSM 17038 TaxID=1121424 RepID=A0A1I2YUZ0_9FIRM|nr:hypothetical protein [Desulfotruncus arcticus]SFH29434.1 hypothetical protein SAMN05660649_04619 [Desulfotomaculum arcticum] [Desulfotruncus arcticus DSM 17038]
MSYSKELSLILAIKNLVSIIRDNTELTIEIDHPRWAKNNLQEIVIGLEIVLLALGDMEELYNKYHIKHYNIGIKEPSLKVLKTQ